MPKFTFNYAVVEDWTAEFEADDLEQAQELFEQAVAEDINLPDLPNYQERNRGLYTDIDIHSLEGGE